MPSRDNQSILKTKTKNNLNQALQNIFYFLLIFSLLSLGCVGGRSNDKENTVERGRLKFVKSGTAISIGKEPIFRSVDQYFYINGQEWSPENDKNLAKRINWCDTSPNPNVKILRCFGDSTENYSTTYILRMKGEEVDLQRLEEGVGSVWANDEGRWLLFRKFFLNVETGEKIVVKGMPWADDEDASAPVTYVLAVSPDMKSVVRKYKDFPLDDSKEKFAELEIIDTESGNSEVYQVDFAKNIWLKDWQDPENNIQPPPATNKKFVWEKGKDGKDKIIVPKLLKKVEKRNERSSD